MWREGASASSRGMACSPDERSEIRDLATGKAVPHFAALMRATKAGPRFCQDEWSSGTSRLGCLRSRKSLYESGATACACGPSVQAGSRMESYPRSTEAFKRDVSADGGASLLAIMRGLWPYIWPADRRDLKLRVAAAMVLLLAAKLATIAVPFTFKWATDALAGEGSAPFAASSGLSQRRSH